MWYFHFFSWLKERPVSGSNWINYFWGPIEHYHPDWTTKDWVIKYPWAVSANTWPMSTVPINSSQLNPNFHNQVHKSDMFWSSRCVPTNPIIPFSNPNFNGKSPCKPPYVPKKSRETSPVRTSQVPFCCRLIAWCTGSPCSLSPLYAWSPITWVWHHMVYQWILVLIEVTWASGECPWCAVSCQMIQLIISRCVQCTRLYTGLFVRCLQSAVLKVIYSLLIHLRYSQQMYHASMQLEAIWKPSGRLLVIPPGRRIRAFRSTGKRLGSGSRPVGVRGHWRNDGTPTSWILMSGRRRGLSRGFINPTWTWCTILNRGIGTWIHDLSHLSLRML